MFDISRIFAIPELEPDKLQMGLSNTSWAIVAATGKTKDGSPAKASVLKQERKGVSQQDIKKAEKVGIKGDRALNSEPRIVKNNVNTKDLIAVKIDGKSVSVPSGSEFVAVKDNHIQSQIVGQRAYRVAPKNGTQDDYIRETAQGQSAPVVKFKTPEQATKYAEKLNKAVAKATTTSPSKLVSHAVNGGTVSAPNAKGENMEITYNKKGDFKKAHVSIKNAKTGESTQMAMTRDQLDTYLSNLDGAKPIEKPSTKAAKSSDKPATKFEKKLKSQFKDRADAIKAKPERFNKNFLARQMSDAIDNEKSVLIDNVIPKIRSGNKRLTTKAKGGKTFEGGVKGAAIGSTVRRQKRAMTDRDIARNAGIASAKLESQGQLNIFNQPKPSAKIAPDTAKKVKRAIAGVKGGKVVKGQMPITGRVVESGKTGKDGFTKSTISIPLHSYNAKGVKISEPTKGERIGNYHVSKDGGRDSGYSITHIPSGTMVLNANVLKGELGSNDKETAKRAAKKLHEAQIPMPKTFQGLKKLQTTKMRPKMQEIGRKVLSSIK